MPINPKAHGSSQAQAQAPVKKALTIPVYASSRRPSLALPAQGRKAAPATGSASHGFALSHLMLELWPWVERIALMTALMVSVLDLALHVALLVWLVALLAYAAARLWADAEILD